jgi:hypothetical protein
MKKLCAMKQMKNTSENKIFELCNHEFEEDLIDVDPDTSKNITYCKFCGFTK